MVETVGNLTQGMTPSGDLNHTEEVRMHGEFGLWYFPGRSSATDLSFFLFMAPYLARQEGQPYPYPLLNNADTIVPVTTFDALADSMQTGANTTKGVGHRGYSTAEAAIGGSDVTDWPRYVGGYILKISSDEILDWRKRQGGLARQVGRQVFQRVTGKLRSPKYVADVVHAEYGSAGAVIIKRPVNGTFDQHRQKLPDPVGVDPVIMILRNPALRPKRVAFTYDYDPGNR